MTPPAIATGSVAGVFPSPASEKLFTEPTISFFQRWAAFLGFTRSISSSMSDARLSCRRYASSRISSRLRSEEHTSELQSRGHLVCRLLLEKKKRINPTSQDEGRHKVQV